jgi:hypothetical protein
MTMALFAAETTPLGHLRWWATNSYERDFVTQMKRLQKSGYDFEAGSREALEGKFGGASVVLLRDLSDVARAEPLRFAEELERIFGRGSIGFLEPVVKYAEAGRFPLADPKKTAYDHLLGQLGPPTGERPDQGSVPLHEHRVRDEEGNYSDNAT